MDANGVYEIEFVLPVIAASTGAGPIFTMTGPASPTWIAAMAEGFNASLANTAAIWTTPTAWGAQLYSSAVPSTTNAAFFRVHAVLRNGANAGTVQLQVKTSSGGTSVTVKAGAFVRYAKIG